MVRMFPRQAFQARAHGAWPVARGRGPWPSVAVEPLKWGESKLRSAVTGFQNLMGKKECKLSYESF